MSKRKSYITLCTGNRMFTITVYRLQKVITKYIKKVIAYKL